MTNLRNHPTFWLASTAEASLARFEAAHGVIPIASAGRTLGEQQALINRWNKGGAANRPPKLYQPAQPASASRHVVGGGLAIDSSGNGLALLHAFGADFGWFFNFAYDVVHFEYDASRDKHKGVQVASIGGRVLGFSQTVANEQDFMNRSQKAGLRVDGLLGANTKAAIKRYQSFLRKYGYNGAIDGIWGGGTQKAHAVYYAAWRKVNK